MSWLTKKIREVFGKKIQKDPEDVERLRVEFKERYHSFKLLLNANTKALEIMSDMERSLEGNRPFGMSFIRSSSTSVAVNVYGMIQNLERLAPGRYSLLKNRFDDIRNRIDRVLSEKKSAPDPRFVIPLEATDKHLADSVGGKMANLGEAARHCPIRTPAGFVITASAWRRMMEQNDLTVEINRRIQAADFSNTEALFGLSAGIQQLILRSHVPDDLAAAIFDAWKGLETDAGQRITVAMRSSAVGEDTAGSSFAGQYRSELNVSRENVLAAYKNVLAGKYSLQAIMYRLKKGLKDEDMAMCVGCMVMVDAVAGGVIYTCNPVDVNDRSLVVNATVGLPKTVVDGSAACDVYAVSGTEPPEIIREEIRPKTRKFVCYPDEGICRMDLTGDSGLAPAVDHELVIALARQAMAIEAFYGSPQDIEWAVTADKTIFILQCRPLLASETDPDRQAAVEDSADSASIVLRGGTTASPGCASGIVYTVDKEFDLLGFPEGAILLAGHALPRWAVLLGRASAVITEQGGMAGHLASVAREFRVPALFGVADARKVLKNGDVITVNAMAKTIHRGKIETLPETCAVGHAIMRGTPAHETLYRVSRWITPLTLLDPDAVDFRPEACKTLHDITRFIHEKSVREMFDFGKNHNFSERSAKQLFHRVPMQWWILNLNDGFTREIKGNYVRIEEIASEPMLAFWEGFAAIPWQGPPVDGKGLLSVMFHSTANPELSTGLRTRIADRNYFLVSKNYCSLSSRLGYHFALMEALVSERLGENYARFQFKGGAADNRRKGKRVAFIRDILNDHGFHSQLRGDNLLARAEGGEKKDILDRIRILGYLSLHTRQLDMIMDNRARVNYYRQKIDRDIDTLTGSGSHVE